MKNRPTLRGAIAACALVTLAAGAPAHGQVYDVEMLEDTGPAENRIDIVILGDGYMASQQPKLTSHATVALSMLWDTSPFEPYRGFFNAHLVHVISEESGADFGSEDVKKDTALDAIFVNGTRHLVVNNGKAVSVALEHVPDPEIVIVLVNDLKYGGTGGNVAVISAATGAAFIVIHELGHTVGHLADEYETETPGYPPCGIDCPEPNVTNHRTYADIKWAAWIDENTPVPTPEDNFFKDTVGAFEGARYQPIGVFRPKMTCMMREHLDQDLPIASEFCEVCREALILSFYETVSPIDATAPAGPLELAAGESVTLSVTHPQTDPPTLVASWILPTGEVAAVGDSFELSAEALGVGDHEVRVRLDDVTEMVRTDADGRLSQEASWQVHVESVLCAQDSYCYLDASCVDPGTVHPDNPCLECDPAAARVSWTADDTNSCDDGDYCNGAEACVDGTCQAGTPPCDDGVYCNGAETCAAGACQPGVAPCDDDGLACTLDCDEPGRACHVLEAGHCLIDGACYADGESAAEDPLKVCQSETNPEGWTEVPCEDVDACGPPPVDEAPGEGGGSDGCRAADDARGGAWFLALLGVLLAACGGRRRATR